MKQGNIGTEDFFPLSLLESVFITEALSLPEKSVSGIKRNRE